MNLSKTHTLRVPAMLSIGLLLTLAAGANQIRGHAGGSGAQVEWDAGLDEDDNDMVGFAGHGTDSKKPKVVAFFLRESYRRGGTAQLVIADDARRVSVQIFHAGAESDWTMANDELFGVPVTPVRSVGTVHGKRVVRIRLGSWPSGVYYAELKAPGERVGYAPFVLSPRHWGEHAVAIVLPTQTWQAYNYRDDDGDGRPNTWYGGGGKDVRLFRPFTHRGVPHHFKHYAAPLLRWALKTGHDADYLSDADLNAISGGKQLRRAYQLLIFEGHHEYVTEHEYDIVTGFRNLGGNLMFMCANNFFRRVNVHSGVMTLVGQWRDLGRQEASLIGVAYYKNDNGKHRRPWIVQKTATRVPWLLENTDLSVGSAFSLAGIEADHVTSASPRQVVVVAKVPNLYEDGRDSHMTYYETAAGAKVFAAGAFSLTSAIGEPTVKTLVENLWERLSRD
jgi:hypothetical protein